MGLLLVVLMVELLVVVEVELVVVSIGCMDPAWPTEGRGGGGIAIGEDDGAVVTGVTGGAASATATATAGTAGCEHNGGAIKGGVGVFAFTFGCDGGGGIDGGFGLNRGVGRGGCGGCGCI